MIRFTLVLSLALALTACGGNQKLGESCTVGGEDYRGDCAEGLVCLGGDGCNGPCEGVCTVPCGADGSCPTGCGCLQNVDARGCAKHDAPWGTACQ